MKISCPQLLATFRLRRTCEWCQRPGALEVAHIFARGMGGGGQLDIPCNLVALGSAFACGCHHEQHQGHRPLRCDLLAVVAARYQVQQFQVEHEISRARRLQKGSVYKCPFTGFAFGEIVISDPAGSGSNVLLPPPPPAGPQSGLGGVAADEGWVYF